VTCSICTSKNRRMEATNVNNCSVLQVCCYSSYLYKCLSYSSRSERVTFRKLLRIDNKVHTKDGCSEMSGHVV
jgi:hypothetical protein